MTPASKRFPELRERDHAILSQVNFIEILLMSTFGESHSESHSTRPNIPHFWSPNKSVQLVSADDPISVSIDAFKMEPDGVSEGGDRAVEVSFLLGSGSATTLSLRWITLWLLTRCSISHTLQSFGSDHGLRKQYPQLAGRHIGRTCIHSALCQALRLVLSQRQSDSHNRRWSAHVPCCCGPVSGPPAGGPFVSSRTNASTREGQLGINRG